MDLRDLEITTRTTKPIRTRGNVVIQRKGQFLGTAIHCGDLLVIGRITGSICAQGEVTFRADAKLLGEIRCRRFVVERKSEVDCAQPVHAEEVEIEGTCQGRFFATRRMVVGRRASVLGDISTPALCIERGAIVDGTIEAGPQLAALRDRTGAAGDGKPPANR